MTTRGNNTRCTIPHHMAEHAKKERAPNLRRPASRVLRPASTDEQRLIFLHHRGVVRTYLPRPSALNSAGLVTQPAFSFTLHLRLMVLLGTVAQSTNGQVCRWRFIAEHGDAVLPVLFPRGIADIDT